MIVRYVITALYSMAILFMPGCSSVPREAVDETKAAIEEAKKAGAEAYAPSQLQAALVSYDLSVKEISVETRKLPFMRKYDKVIETLRSAISAAHSAEAAVEITKKRIRTETEELLAQTQGMADTVDTLLFRAVKKKMDFGTIPAQLDTIRIAAMNASTAIGSGELLLAKEKAMEAHGKAQEALKSAEALFPPPVKKIRVKRR